MDGKVFMDLWRVTSQITPCLALGEAYRTVELTTCRQATDSNWQTWWNSGWNLDWGLRVFEVLFCLHTTLKLQSRHHCLSNKTDSTGRRKNIQICSKNIHLWFDTWCPASLVVSVALWLAGCGFNSSWGKPKTDKMVPLPPCLASVFRVGLCWLDGPVIPGCSTAAAHRPRQGSNSETVFTSFKIVTLGGIELANRGHSGAVVSAAASLQEAVIGSIWPP